MRPRFNNEQLHTILDKARLELKLWIHKHPFGRLEASNSKNGYLMHFPFTLLNVEEIKIEEFRVNLEKNFEWGFTIDPNINYRLPVFLYYYQ